MVQIAKDVYTFTGGGSNSSFVVTNDGVFLRLFYNQLMDIGTVN